MRLSDQDIGRLLKISWWNREIEKTNKHLSLIYGSDIKRLDEWSI
jgi:hypothetical protein